MLPPAGCLRQTVEAGVRGPCIYPTQTWYDIGGFLRPKIHIHGTTFQMANIVFQKAHDLIDHIKKVLAVSTLWN